MLTPSLHYDKRAPQVPLSVLELRTVTLQTALDYLATRDPGWSEICSGRRRRSLPRSFSTLRTPLMASLALFVSRSDGGPERIVTAEDKKDLRNQLLDRYVRSAFEVNRRLRTTSASEQRHERGRAAARAWPPSSYLSPRWRRCSWSAPRSPGGCC